MKVKTKVSSYITLTLIIINRKGRCRQLYILDMHLLINCCMGVLCSMGINSFEIHVGCVIMCVIGVDWNEHVWVLKMFEKPR